MSFSGLLDQVATVTRLTDQVVDSVAIAATVTIDRQPAEECYLDIILADSVGGGNFFVTGAVDGVPTTEQLTGLSDGTERTLNKFSSITGITTSGFTAGSVVVVTRTLEGSPLYQTKSLYTSMRCRKYKKQFTEFTYVPGESEKDRFMLMSDSDHPLIRGDRVTISSIVHEVKANSVPVRSNQKLHHHETEIQQIL